MEENRPRPPYPVPRDQGGVLPPPPRSVRSLRTLGHGRAAQAELVVAEMADGSEVTCVEKVFAPGLLTRLIYRLSFQSPFAYQTNRSAIAACFFRRRVAAAVLELTDTGVEIAKPLYVRFDVPRKAWVLAAEWIDGRGIRPASADPTRFRRLLKRLTGRGKNQTATAGSGSAQGKPDESPEIVQLVGTMDRLETILADSGLVGSGWQVAPKALVSTANLLRTDGRYTIIDLESGIPAVLVPKYLWIGLRQGSLPPFDDLDAASLRLWRGEQDRLLTFRLGPEKVTDLSDDVEALIRHTADWKESELAFGRRPWRLLSPSAWAPYQAELRRRWQQEGVIDSETAKTLAARPIKSRLIWWASLLPLFLGRMASRLIGNAHYRSDVLRCLRDRDFRRARWKSKIDRHQAEWIESGRLPERTRLTGASWAMHRCLKSLTPSSLHRLLIDRRKRGDLATRTLLLLFCPRYQSWFGGQRIRRAIDRWVDTSRIDEAEADRLRANLCGHEVSVYTRGFGMHLGLKTLAPVVLPAKVGGVAAFFASANPWFLLPMLATPAMRTAVTLGSAWRSRERRVRHREALLAGMLPVVGSIAFPLQMFSTRSYLSAFLIRDAASRMGRRLPIYGGADSRTEMAMIRLTDPLIESMQIVTAKIGRASANPVSADSEVVQVPRTRWGRWLDRQALARIAESATAESVAPSQEQIAA